MIERHNSDLKPKVSLKEVCKVMPILAHYCWKNNCKVFPPVGRWVGWLDGRPVCHNFLKERKFTLLLEHLFINPSNK